MPAELCSAALMSDPGVRVMFAGAMPSQESSAATKATETIPKTRNLATCILISKLAESCWTFFDSFTTS